MPIPEHVSLLLVEGRAMQEQLPRGIYLIKSPLSPLLQRGGLNAYL